MREPEADRGGDHRRQWRLRQQTVLLHWRLRLQGGECCRCLRRTRHGSNNCSRSPAFPPSFLLSLPTQSGGSDRAVRDALYTRLYNIVNAAGSDSVAGDALADGVASRGALFKRLFTEPGVAQLDAALRKAKELTFDGTRFITLFTALQMH